MIRDAFGASSFCLACKLLVGLYRRHSLDVFRSFYIKVKRTNASNPKIARSKTDYLSGGQNLNRFLILKKVHQYHSGSYEDERPRLSYFRSCSIDEEALRLIK